MAPTRALEQARQFDDDPVAMEGEWYGRAETWVRAAGGDISGALRCTLAQAERTIQAETPALAVTALHFAVRLGAAVQVVDRLVELLPTMQGPLPELVGAHARASAAGDGTALLTVADGFAALGFLVYAAEAAAQAADAFSARRGSGSAAVRCAAGQATQLARLCQRTLIRRHWGG